MNNIIIYTTCHMNRHAPEGSFCSVGCSGPEYLWTAFFFLGRGSRVLPIAILLFLEYNDLAHISGASLLLLMLSKFIFLLKVITANWFPFVPKLVQGRCVRIFTFSIGYEVIMSVLYFNLYFGSTHRTLHQQNK